jgi:hypothetical protein
MTGLAREQLALEACDFFTSKTMCRSPMPSELKINLETPRRRTADGSVRLSPVQPRSTLLTVLFFSAVVLAIGYWIFFPPAAPTTPETAAAPTAQSAPADSSESKNPVRPD